MASVDHYHCKQRIFEWLQTVLCGMYSTEKLSLQFWRWQFFQQVILKLQRYWQVLDVLFFLNESKTTRVTIVCLTVKQKKKKKHNKKWNGGMLEINTEQVASTVWENEIQVSTHAHAQITKILRNAQNLLLSHLSIFV